MASADVYISLRFSEARDKAQLLDEALRKRGINAVMADPQSRWDRHGDISGKVGRLLTAADLVVIIATPLYGRKLRSHFGSSEEIDLIEYLQKPTFVIQACNEVCLPFSVTILENRELLFVSDGDQPSCVRSQWNLFVTLVILVFNGLWENRESLRFREV
mmetsp:Transcript_35385/g.45628  ORF Transcript_35385/g.45628 Transcript_35385/m.45628 type:complete len:160 (-) Transcript_35385:1521-2000(-)